MIIEEKHVTGDQQTQWEDRDKLMGEQVNQA